MTRINTERIPQPYRNRLMVDTGKLYRIYTFHIRVLRYFMARDEMNALLHEDAPKWSPLTETAEIMKVELEELLREGDKK
jgi:hypothetical protein